MGLFSKETCCLCGSEAGALGRTKLSSGDFLCVNCLNKVGLCEGFTAGVLKDMSPIAIKDRIAFHDKDVKENEERLAFFNATVKEGSFIWFDDNHKWFVLPKGTLNAKIDKSYVFRYDEIIDFEVLEDGTSITKGGLGKALVGGYVFGLAGAIAGGTSKKTKQICNKLEVKITTRNQDHPALYIKMLSGETKKDSWVYKQLSKNVQNILSKFMVIVDQLEQENQVANQPLQGANSINPSAGVSVADEIKKFKELLDMGAITQEEFDMKKKELLGF